MSNSNAIRRKLRLFVETDVHRDVISILERVADRIILNIENDAIPVDTGNLQDSTGIGIYHGDVLKRYIPRQTAIVSRSNIYPDGLTTRNDVWGYKEIQSAINYGAMKYSNDYCLVIFSAMPYANLVDARTNYFNEITKELHPLIVRILMQTK